MITILKQEIDPQTGLRATAWLVTCSSVRIHSYIFFAPAHLVGGVSVVAVLSDLLFIYTK